MIRCDECRCWVRSDDATAGDCRAAPPLVFALNGEIVCAWPSTAAESGCDAGIKDDPV